MALYCIRVKNRDITEVLRDTGHLRSTLQGIASELSQKIGHSVKIGAEKKLPYLFLHNKMNNGTTGYEYVWIFDGTSLKMLMSKKITNETWSMTLWRGSNYNVIRGFGEIASLLSYLWITSCYLRICAISNKFVVNVLSIIFCLSFVITFSCSRTLNEH